MKLVFLSLLNRKNPDQQEIKRLRRYIETQE